MEEEVHWVNWTLPNDDTISGLPNSNITTRAGALWQYYLDNRTAGLNIDNSTDANLGRVEVINLWGAYSSGSGGSDRKQSQLYYNSDPEFGREIVPEPATLALGGMATILPWAARNYFLLGEPVLIETFAWENLWYANALVGPGVKEAQRRDIVSQRTTAEQRRIIRMGEPLSVSL